MSGPVRVPPQPPEEWSDPNRTALLATIESVADMEVGAGVARRRDPLAILTVIAHHPTFLPPFLGWASALALQGTLAPADAELLALRAGWLARSDFEWGHHVVYARAAGLSDEAIDRVAAGPEAPGWDAHQEALLRACDELVATHHITDETWSRLAEHFDTAQLVEIPFVVGQYTMLSMVANGLGVQLEPGHPHLPDPPHR